MPKKMDRTGYVGASDIPSILGLDFGCPKRLYYEKRGIEPDYPFQENFHMRRGQRLEGLAAKEFQKIKKKKLTLCKPVQNKAFPFIVGHPDRLIIETNSPLEIKCPSLRMFKKIEYEGIPESYIVQLQLYMFLLGSFVGSFAIYNVDADLLTFDYKQDPELICKILGRIREFWEMVLKAVEPDRLEMTDKRCRTCQYRLTCWGVAYMNENELPEATDRVLRYDLTDLVQEYQQAKAIEKEAEEYVGDVACRLKAKLGETQVVEVDGARVYHRPYEQWRWDTKALEAKHPELAQEFKKKSIVTPLKVYNI